MPIGFLIINLWVEGLTTQSQAVLAPCILLLRGGALISLVTSGLRAVGNTYSLHMGYLPQKEETKDSYKNVQIGTSLFFSGGQVMEQKEFRDVKLEEMKENIGQEWEEHSLPLPPPPPTSERFRVEGVRNFQDVFQRVNEAMTRGQQSCGDFVLSVCLFWWGIRGQHCFGQDTMTEKLADSLLSWRLPTICLSYKVYFTCWL